jgi:hypothetical protein
MRASASLLLILAALGGCALPVGAPDWLSDDSAGPEPVNYRFIVANSLNAIMGTRDTDSRLLEIASPRRVSMARGATWLVCVKALRFPSRQPRALYAVFIQRERIIDFRLSVGTDQCEGEVYTPFNWSRDIDNPIPLNER